MRLGWFLVLFYFSPVYTGEFLYPVGVDYRSPIIYLIYQKTPSHIELWGWNYTTKHAYQMLLSRFTPAGFRMLPDGKGFSFIDKGILKVKQFFKRSPRIIEFDAPLYNVEVVHWIDDHSCYTSGKYREHFGIFYIDYDGMVSPLCISDDADCMYPQKAGDKLFYIERDEQWHCRIAQTEYVLPPDYATFSDRQEWYKMHRSPSQTLLDFGQNQIVFLYMISKREGFVVEHSRSISKRDTSITFSYHHIKKTRDNWTSENLFTYSVPSELLFSGNPARLYEALLPLLPYHYKNYIWYVDSVNNDLGIFVYDIHKKLKKSVLLKENQSFFSPMLIQGKIFCGGMMVQGGKIGMEENTVGVSVNLEEVPVS